MKNKYSVKPLSLTVINFIVAHDLMALGSVKKLPCLVIRVYFPFQKLLMAGGPSTSDFNKPTHGLKVLLLWCVIYNVCEDF